VGVKSYRWRLEAMLEDIALIKNYTGSLEYEDFSGDPMRMDATIRRLARLGESTKYLPNSVLLEHPNVPWEEMRSVRNFLVHDYFGISSHALWLTVTVELPRLERLLVRVLEDWKEA